MNSTETLPDISHIVRKWGKKRGSLIMALHDVQSSFGYIPRNIALQLAQMMSVPLARIYEVITFYNYFRLEPPGKNNIAICQGTACYLKGGNDLEEKFSETLNIPPGETTSCGKVHLESVRCVGCCGLAPVVVVNGVTLSKVELDQVGGIVSECMQEETESTLVTE